MTRSCGSAHAMSGRSARYPAGLPGLPVLRPYGGQYADVVPHLTIGQRGAVAELRTAEEAVRPHLPVEAAAAEVTLMAGPSPDSPGTEPGRWHDLAAFPLGAPNHGVSDAMPSYFLVQTLRCSDVCE